MNKFLNVIKCIFRAIGRTIKFVFIAFYKGLLFLLNNTIGLFFTKQFTPYNKTKIEDNKIWKNIRTTILIVILLVLIFCFNIIYEHTLGLLLGNAFTLLGEKISPNIYGLILAEYGHRFSRGIGTTLYLSLIGTTIGFILSLFLGVVVTLKPIPTNRRVTVFFKNFSSRLVKLYVAVVRGTPMMVQAMILYFGVYGLLKWDPMTAGLVVVSINTTAYLTEVIRGGIESIDKGQTEGALSLGLGNFQAMLFVVLPQAVKNSMASIGNEFVINIKDTSVLSVIMISDLFRVAQLAQAKYNQAFPPFIIAAIIYLVLTTSITALLKQMSKKLDVPTVQLPSSN